MEQNLISFCADLDWSPISYDDQNISHINTSFKKNLLKEIIQCRQLGHSDISVRLAEKGLNIFKNDPLLFDNLARAYKKLNNHKDAILNWTNVLSRATASETIKISALNNLFQYHDFRQNFFCENSTVSSSLNPELKILIEASIDFRKNKEPRIALYFLEKAWIKGFKHPAMVDNYARIQALLGNWYQSFESWSLLTSTTTNQNIKAVAQKSLDIEEQKYFTTIGKDILKLSGKFNQKSAVNITNISSFLDFVKTRINIKLFSVEKEQAFKFNVALFKYLQHKKIDAFVAYEMYITACIELGYIAEAESFYLQYPYLLISNKEHIENQLELQKSKIFPHKIGLINKDFALLASTNKLDVSKLSLKDINTYSDLQNFSEKLLEEFLQQSFPRIVIDIFEIFKQHHFVTPLMLKFHGIACIDLNLKDKAIASFQDFICFTQGPVGMLDLDEFKSTYSEMIFTDELKQAIYKQLDNENYYSAATILVNAILISRQFTILDKPDLISLVFNHKKFFEDVKCPVKRELTEEYSNISFYSNFLLHCKSIFDDKIFMDETF